MKEIKKSTKRKQICIYAHYCRPIQRKIRAQVFFRLALETLVMDAKG